MEDIDETTIEENWELLKDTTHYDHEAILRFLQDHPDGRSVPHIKEAILLKPRLGYLDYDDYGSYYKKCLWALQEIGTPEAVRLIRECAKSDIPELRDEAIYRLSKPPLSELSDR
jgi:HEAT repeat protein